MAQGQKSLFFCQSRAITEKVAETMRRAGTTVFVHHSAVSKEERLLAEKAFHQGTADGSDACIVCTSTLKWALTWAISIGCCRPSPSATQRHCWSG
jgi:ATP-dependent helicase Lhr and Lhr-like helicase